MADTKKYIAVDLGAESGRVMIGTVSNEKLSLEEVHRFSNGPIKQDDSLRWDFEKLMSDIKTGIARAAKAAGSDISGIAVDSWGVDYGLLGEDGKLLENPYHYRDSRTDNMVEKACELLEKRQIYGNTGIQFMQLNTAYQLLSMQLAGSEVLKKTKSMLFMADLVAYYLCGVPFGEYTLASTSQLMDMKTGQWSKTIFDAFSLPIDIMPKVCAPATVMGKLTKEVANELSCEQIPVIAPASHDTGAAVAAVPAGDYNWAYLSSGTWSLIGLEIPKPIINDRTYELQLTNEGGVENTIRLLKNIMGLWIVQECKRHWQSQGQKYDYTQLTEMAQKAQAFKCYIDTEYPEFFSPGDMPDKINRFFSKTNQQTITEHGQFVRVVLEGLALRCREVAEFLEDVSRSKVDVLHMVGGGTKNQLLCQFTANATGKKVVTGPVEATALGNVLTQAIATGQIDSLHQARQIVKNSIDLKEYQPEDIDLWQKHYEESKKVLKKS